VKSLHAKIGELTLEHDFLEGALGKAGLLSAKRWSTARTTFERTLIRARTGEGRECAKARGVRFGPPKKLSAHQR
jgi:hypothetical protein